MCNIERSNEILQKKSVYMACIVRFKTGNKSQVKNAFYAVLT